MLNTEKQLETCKRLNTLLESILEGMEFESHPMITSFNYHTLSMKNYKSLLYRIINKHKDLDIIGDNFLEQFISLLKFLEDRTEYYRCPGSTSYHSSYRHGLFYHSLNTMRIYPNILKGYLPLFLLDYSSVSYSADVFLDFRVFCKSLFLTTFFHDLGKVGQMDTNSNSYICRYELGDDLIYDNLELQGQLYSFKYNLNLTEVDTPTLSLYYLSKFFELSPQEIQAVVYHDNDRGNKFLCYNETPLLILLKQCDLFASMIETGKNVFLSNGRVVVNARKISNTGAFAEK